MIKPLAIECGKESFKLNKGTYTFVADEVLTAAYEYNGQKVQFVVNYNTRGVQIRLPKKVDVILDSIGMQSLTGIETLDMPPLSAVMMKLWNENEAFRYGYMLMFLNENETLRKMCSVLLEDNFNK